MPIRMKHYRALFVHYVFFKPVYRWENRFTLWWVKLVDPSFGQGGG